LLSEFLSEFLEASELLSGFLLKELLSEFVSGKLLEALSVPQLSG
jgi:hypothetical protein